MERIWKDIQGYESLYQISNDGLVKSLHKIFEVGKGGFMEKEESIRKIAVSKKGYSVCELSVNGLRNTFQVHRLVAQAFIPNNDNKPQVNHIDGNKLNNNVENLEWCTNSENAIHAFKIGLKSRLFGEDNPNSKLNKTDIYAIRHLHYVNKKGNTEISKIFNVSKDTIYLILKNKRYSNV